MKDYNNMKDYYNREDYYLYHSEKNEELISGCFPLIIISPFIAICKSGILVLIIIWGLFFLALLKNKTELENDPYVLERREYYRKLKYKIDNPDPALAASRAKFQELVKKEIEKEKRR